jgi:RNA polymerase sigma-70 factor (ECF subfamily)
VELALTSTDDVPRDELEELLERDRERLIRIAWRILGDRDEAEDVVQQTLLGSWRALRADEIRQPASYLARAVRWNAIKRRARRGRELPLEALSEATTDRSPGADRLDALELEHAIAQLPIAQQSVIRLRFYLGLSFCEIGRNLSISTNTAASRTRYALAGLRRLLGASRFESNREERHE